MKSLRQLVNDWKIARGALDKLQKDLPRIIGNESARAVKENFKLQGYDSGTGVKSWPARSEATNKSYNRRSGVKGTVYNSASPILEQTKNLFNAVKYKASGNRVDIGVDTGLVPYAEKMNTGGPGKWGKNATHTPARQFTPGPGDPPNAKMLKAIVKKVNSQRDKALKDFKR
jgi:hypothetical protein